MPEGQAEVVELNQLQPIDIYRRVLTIVRWFLEETRSMLTIEDLAALNPSVEEISKGLKELAGLMRVEAEVNSYEHEDMALNALQVASKMAELSAVVKSGEQEALDLLMKQLEMHCNVPQA